jgi:hypothetical protein
VRVNAPPDACGALLAEVRPVLRTSRRIAHLSPRLAATAGTRPAQFGAVNSKFALWLPQGSHSRKPQTTSSDSGQNVGARSSASGAGVACQPALAAASSIGRLRNVTGRLCPLLALASPPMLGVLRLSLLLLGGVGCTPWRWQAPSTPGPSERSTCRVSRTRRTGSRARGADYGAVR